MASHPAQIGKYNVESIIGRGGMGVVYKAVDSQIGRYVAIKMILSGGDQSLLERFRSEARSTGSLQCPNIVTVYDYGEQDGNPYLVMQYLEGTSLETMLQKGAQLSLSERLGIIVDVCNGLAYAHQRGVIHRDIKPANIIVLQDGVNDGMAMIVDFGIARIAGAARLTRTDQIIGSVHYMSPEQLQAKELDNRTDIYATGVVLFQLLTGVLPFEAPDTAATLLKIVNDPPPPLSNYVKEYPAELEGVVNRALAKKRENRYASARELALDLMQVQEQVKSEAVAHLVHRAESALAREEWTKAREQLQQALRIDRQSTQVHKLMTAVQERLRQQQQIEQARALRSQADEAYMDQRYDDALRLLDQAVTLDPNNTDLHTLRESVRLSKDRATGLRRALRRAEAALQDGDLDEAQSAVSEAFKIDPYDTQAKALKVIISQHAEERVRQQQLQKLLDQARNQVTARELTEAFATLKEAEALDPTSIELQSVARMAVSAREQERRRAETEELRKQIEAALVREDYTTAVAKAEEGLRKFPQEQSLLKLKALAEAQRTRIELKKFVRDQFVGASSLAEAGQLVEAVAVLDRALQRVPGNSELETLRSTLQERLAAAESERQRVQAMEAALAEARRIFQGRGAGAAREFLESQATPYTEFPQVRELYEAMQAREALDLLDERLASESNPATRVQLAEEAARANPENSWIRQRLADLQQIRAQIAAVMDRAQGFEAGGRLSDAVREWQQLRGAYPQVPEFDAQLRRLKNLETARAAPPKPVVVPPAAPQPAGARKPAASLSATRVIDSASVADMAPTEVMPAAVKTEIAPPPREVAPPPRKIVPRPTPAPAPPKPPAPAPHWQLKNLLAGPQKYIVVAAAAVLVLAAGYLIFSGGKKTVAVEITTIPPDTEVSVASQKCRAPCKLELQPGNHELRAQKDGFDPVTQLITVGRDTTSLPAITLSAIKPPQPVDQGILVVRANLDDAAVYVDGNPTGFTDTHKKYETKIDVGKHKITIKKPGFEDSEQDVEIAKGQSAPLSFKLTKSKAPASEAEVGYIVVTANPQAAVVIDGRFQGNVSGEGGLIRQLAPGRHAVEVSLSGFKSYSTNVEIKPNEKQRLAAVLTELPKPSAPIRPAITFNATSTSIQSGESVQLSWQTQNADEVSLEPGGSVGKSGSTTVKPAVTTTYTLAAKGGGGVDKKSVTIGVAAAAAPAARPSIGQFGAGPNTIQAGQSATLFWATQNATEVSVDQGVGSGLPGTGSRPVTPSQTTRYTLTARGSDGTVVSQPVTVTVEARAAVTTTSEPSSGSRACIDRFKDAYGSMSVDEIVKAWPAAGEGRTRNALKDSFKGAQAIKLDEECSDLPAESQDTARYQCRETMTYTREGKRQRPETPKVIEFVCKKTASGWVVQSRTVK